MSEIELPKNEPVEAHDAKEGMEVKEAAQSRSLDDATYEPGSYVEQTGDFRQSEAIQINFTAAMNAGAAIHEAPGKATSANGDDGSDDSGSKGDRVYSPAASLQGMEDRNTVRGQEPTLGKGAFGYAPGASDDHYTGGQPCGDSDGHDGVNTEGPGDGDHSNNESGDSDSGEDDSGHKVFSPTVSMQGTEDRNTVRGLEPTLVKGAFEPKPEASGIIE